MPIQEFEKRFDEIDKSKEPTRTKRLSNLMSDMEQVYRIPVQNDVEFNKNNIEVINLYKKVSMARSFEGVN